MSPAFAVETTGIYVEGGGSMHSDGGAKTLTLGMTVPFTPMQSVQGGAVSFYWDFFLSEWRAHAPSGNDRNYTQIGALANWRYRFGEGTSPWFVEAGIGGTIFNHLYRTPGREFSTAFQFTEQLGVGYSFGARREHELALRLQHVSNAGIKKPNPGEDMVKVRYLYRF